MRIEGQARRGEHCHLFKSMGRSCWFKLATSLETSGRTWRSSHLQCPCALSIMQSQERCLEDIEEKNRCLLSKAHSILWRSVSFSEALVSRGPTGHMVMCPKRCLGSLEGMEPCHAWGMSLCLEVLYKGAEKHPLPQGFVPSWRLPSQASVLCLPPSKFSPPTSCRRRIIDYVFWHHM